MAVANGSDRLLFAAENISGIHGGIARTLQLQRTG